MRMPLGWVVLCVLALVAGAATGATLKGEDCGRGASVIGVFYENPCDGRENPFPRLRISPMQLFPLPLTVPGLRAYLTNYCRMAMPEVRRCFADQLRVCEASQQDYLNRLALNTSLICATNSTDLSAWITFLLSRLTDQQVAGSDQCIHDDRGLFPSCRQEAANVSGLLTMDPDNLQTAPVADLLPVTNSFFNAFMQCLIRRVRDDPNRCPDWRMRALELVLPLTGPPPLGLTFNLTQAQITELFVLNERRRNIPPPFTFMP